MNYIECLDYIHSIPKLGKKLGHDHIRYLLTILGDPHKALKFVHIAGTNGKGSVANYMSTVLTCSGYKTGKFTSPFIETFNERICINDISIDDNSLIRITTKVKDAVGVMEKETGNILSEFETITVIGFLYFQEQNCDFVVLETGVGGRFDATNVIENPLVSVITKIDIDHTKYLGETIAKIAFEKCGIIKPGCPVISYPNQANDAIDVIKEQAKEKNSDLYIVKTPNIKSQSLLGNIFDYKELTNITISLVGEYQMLNAATALETIYVLKSKYNIKIKDSNIFEGMRTARNKGRFEVYETNPILILDGAHNPNGINAFIKSLKSYIKGKKIIAVMGMLADKNYSECVKIISSNVDFLIFTSVPSNRSANPYELLEQTDKSSNKHVYENYRDAITFAKSIADINSVICVIGSLYLIGEVMSNIEDLK